MDNHSTHIMTDVRHHGFKGVVITESVGFVDENSSVNDTKKLTGLQLLNLPCDCMVDGGEVVLAGVVEVPTKNIE